MDQQDALKKISYTTLDNFSLDYARVQNNLGNTYQRLSAVFDEEKNLNLAIKAYKEALKIYTKKKYPQLYEDIRRNMREAQRILGLSKRRTK
jgi:tetratricopeptide (TPR) repeat protein